MAQSSSGPGPRKLIDGVSEPRKSAFLISWNYGGECDSTYDWQTRQGEIPSNPRMRHCVHVFDARRLTLLRALAGMLQDLGFQSIYQLRPRVGSIPYYVQRPKASLA